MSDQIRLAVVGMGAVARAVHLPVLSRRSDRFIVTGICDLAREATDGAGDRFGIPEERRFGDLNHMLDAVEADALGVFNSGSHTEAVLAGLRRDIPVFSEKPLCYTRRESNEIGAVLGGRDDRLMVGYMKLHDPAVARARELIENRGRVRSIEVTVLHPSAAAQLAHSELETTPLRPDPQATQRLRAAEEELEREALGPAAEAIGRLYSSVLLGSLVHDLAVLRSFGFRIAEVDHAERWPPDTFPPSVAVLARTPEQVRLSFRWHYLENYAAYREEIRFHDPEGTVSLTFPSPYLLRAPTELKVTSPVERGSEQTWFRSPVEAFEEQWLAFHRMVTEGVAPAAGLADGYADVVACQQMASRLAESEGMQIGGEAELTA